MMMIRRLAREGRLRLGRVEELDQRRDETAAMRPAGAKYAPDRVAEPASSSVVVRILRPIDSVLFGGGGSAAISLILEPDERSDVELCRRSGIGDPCRGLCQPDPPPGPPMPPPPPPREPPPVCQTIKSTFKGTLSGDVFANASGGGAKPKDLFVYVVGGVTYEEATKVAELNAANAGVSVVLGGSFVHNSGTFLEDLDDAFGGRR